LVREVREELSIDLALHDVAPQPHAEVAKDDLHLSIWRVTAWTGDPFNAAPDEHDVIGWFSAREAAALPLAHADYPALLTRLTAATFTTG
jgi:8-oxo-dGTP pyrophosphatase MutT (NUDIX family)